LASAMTRWSRPTMGFGSACSGDHDARAVRRAAVIEIVFVDMSAPSRRRDAHARDRLSQQVNERYDEPATYYSIVRKDPAVHRSLDGVETRSRSRVRLAPTGRVRLMGLKSATLRVATAGVGVVAAVSLSACSSSKSNPASSTSPAGTQTAAASSTAASSAAADAAAVKLVYQKFFDPKTPIAVKPALLQDGLAFVKAIHDQSSTAYAKGSSVSVSNVTVLSANRASVTFSIIYGGKPVVSNQGGWAVKQGTWKVAGTTFCGLVSLSGTTPAACMTVKATSLPS
jgi:hypothetical protein